MNIPGRLRGPLGESEYKVKLAGFGEKGALSLKRVRRA